MKKILTATMAIVLCAAVSAAAIDGGDIPVFEESDAAPYAGFLFDRTPDIVRVDQTPAQPLAGQAVKVSAVIEQNTLRASLPVKKVDLHYRTDGGEWQDIPMLRGDDDPDYYFAFIPPVPAGTMVDYFIRAEDKAGSVTAELPPGGSISVYDPDEKEEVVPADIDVLRVEAEYDDKYLYVTLDVEGKPGKGDMTDRGAYIYLLPMIDVKAGQGAADLFEVPLLGYAPIMSNYLGVPEAGLYRLSEILETKKQIEGADVKVKKGPHGLKFRVKMDSISTDPEGVIGMAAMTIAASNFESLMPWEASPYLTFHMKRRGYAVSEAPEEVTFRAGLAERDITPPVGTPLAGYGARQGGPSTGVHDPLLAQALVLEAGEQKYVLISSDMFYIRRGFYKDVGALIEEKTGIPRDHLLLSAQHSHSSSGGLFPELALLGGAVVPGLYEDVLGKFIDAVVEADSNLEPVRIGTGSADAEGLNNNRVEEGGPVDPELSVMKVENMKGEPIAFYYNFSAHPTVLGGGNMEFSADFPGAVRKHVAEEYPGARALFVNGCLGNMSPAYPGKTEGDFDKIDKMGILIAGHIADISKDIEMQEKAGFSFITREILMHPQFDMWTTMAGMRIGDAAFVSDPGELFTDLGFPVRERAADLGFKTTFILGITDDGIGYIIPEKWYYKHVYEATFALYGPKEGEFVRDMMLSTVNQLAGSEAEKFGSAE